MTSGGCIRTAVIEHLQQGGFGKDGWSRTDNGETAAARSASLYVYIYTHNLDSCPRRQTNYIFITI